MPELGTSFQPFLYIHVLFQLLVSCQLVIILLNLVGHVSILNFNTHIVAILISTLQLIVPHFLSSLSCDLILIEKTDSQ